jgi:AbiV family abortive infection protein
MGAATSDYILRGAAFSLEQCGLLLCDARALYKNESYASSVALAAFAREELGRYQILRELWKCTVAGESFTVDQIRKECGDHVEKQRRGMLSTVLRPKSDSGLGRLLNEARFHPAIGTPEWQKANEQLGKIFKSATKRTPDRRHSLREQALYVEALEADWSRPVEIITKTVAYEFLTDATND